MQFGFIHWGLIISFEISNFPWDLDFTNFIEEIGYRGIALFLIDGR